MVSLAKDGDARQRGMACRALAELSQKRPALAGSVVTWPAYFPDRYSAEERTCELTLPILMAALRDADPTVQAMAADAMAIFIGGEEEQAMEIEGRRKVFSPAVVGDRRGLPALTTWLLAGSEQDYGA